MKVVVESGVSEKQALGTAKPSAGNVGGISSRRVEALM